MTGGPDLTRRLLSARGMHLQTLRAVSSIGLICVSKHSPYCTIVLCTISRLVVVPDWIGRQPAWSSVRWGFPCPALSRPHWPYDSTFTLYCTPKQLSTCYMLCLVAPPLEESSSPRCRKVPPPRRCSFQPTRQFASEKRNEPGVWAWWWWQEGNPGIGREIVLGKDGEGGGGARRK